MLNIIQNTIGAIRRVGESVVRAGLKMWLPFTKTEPLGENLVVNGDFSQGITGWAPDNANLSYSNNSLKIEIASNGFAGAYQPITTVVGKRYRFEATYSSLQGIVNNLFLYAGTSTSTVNNLLNKVISPSAGTSSATFVATTTTTYVYVGLSFDATESVEVDNISVEEYAQETPDISGNDNNAILKTGKALVFAGNDSVETVFPSSKDIKTIAFWIYPTHTASGETLFYFGGTGQGTKFLYLNHLTLRKDSFGGMDFSVYVDGVYRGNTYEPSNYVTLVQDEWQRVVLTTSTAYNTISDAFDVAYKGFGSHGRFKMSDLQIYGAEFTTDDIAYDYANPQKLVTDNASSNVTLNDLHAWWHMSEGNGTIAFDSAPLIGKELVVNGDFATDSDWNVYDREQTASSGWSIDNGSANYDGSGSQFNRIYQGFTTVVGRKYKMTFTLSGLSGNTVNFGFGNWNGSLVEPQVQYNSNGTYTRIMVADRIDHSISIQNNNATQTFSIDNISVKEVFNIDGETYDGSSLGATYDDAQERIPQLGMMNWSKGSNVLTNSNDFGANPWNTQSGSVDLVSGYEAPDGTLSAWKVSRTGGSGTGILFDGTVTANIGVVRSIWAKTVSGTGTVHLTSQNGNLNSLFTITNEWQRFSATCGSAVAGNFYSVDFRDTNATLSEVIIWGAQEEVNVGDSLSAFRKTDGTAVTDAALISCATDSQKDILGNAVRVKGSGFNLDGTGYGEVEHSTDLDFGTGDFSVSGWVKFSYVAQGSSFNAIYTNGGQVDASNTFSIMSVNPNKIAFLVNTTSCTSTTTFSDGEWVHIVATRNSGTASIYINGNKTPEQTKNTANTNATVTSSQNPRIGFDGNTARFYDDLIDDVQVYDRYLTPDEVEQNYNATKSGHNN